MKKTLIYTLSIAAIALCATSCNKFLSTQSPSTFDEATIFSSSDLAEGAIFGITETFCEVNSYRGRFLPWYGFNTDIEWYNTYKATDDKTQIATYNVSLSSVQFNTASGGATNNPWALMYAGIERANLAVEGIRNYGSKDDEKLQYLLGEALTLRAMIYYDLIKAWGDVPARFEPTTSATIYVPKSSRDEIFVQILQDLEEAMDYLPWPGADANTSRTDRINKAFAKGLYARIALAASGYALRPEEGQVGTGNAGSNRLSTNENLQQGVLYPKILKHLKDVIESGSCSLEASFEQYWKNQSNLANLTAGPGYETLYVIPFGDGRGRWNFTFAVKSEGSSYSGGVERGGDAGPVPAVFFAYALDDTRRDVTCINYSWQKDGSAAPAGISKWYFGKYRYEWMQSTPYGGGNDDGVKPVVMRYADILLMAAEVSNALEGPTAENQGWFRQVRERACGEASAEEYVAENCGTQDAFFEAIKDERAFEFCGEFLRKGDLIRWGILKESMDAAVDAMKALRDLQTPFDYLTGDIYYREAEDGSCEIYGLLPGEQDVPAGEWEKKEKYVNADYSKKTTEGMGTERITLGMYTNDPEQYMFWPVFSCNITDSQGTLVNDYQY